MPSHVFISYSSKDTAAAEAIRETFEGAGLRCWMAPRDVPAGVEYAAAIIDAIEASAAVALIFSEHANASVQVRREIERAVSKDVPILPLRLGAVVPSKTLEYFLSSVHWLELDRSLPRESLDRALTAVRALVAKPGERGGFAAHFTTGKFPLVAVEEAAASKAESTTAESASVPPAPTKPRRHRRWLLAAAALPIAALAVALLSGVPGIHHPRPVATMQLTEFFHYIAQHDEMNSPMEGPPMPAGIVHFQLRHEGAARLFHTGARLDLVVNDERVSEGVVVLSSGNTVTVQVRDPAPPKGTKVRFTAEIPERWGIPNDAVDKRDGHDVVFLRGPDGRAHERKVDVVDRGPRDTLVRAGAVKAGDELIVSRDDVTKLQDGDRVAPNH